MKYENDALETKLEQDAIHAYDRCIADLRSTHDNLRFFRWKVLNYGAQHTIPYEIGTQMRTDADNEMEEIDRRIAVVLKVQNHMIRESLKRRGMWTEDMDEEDDTPVPSQAEIDEADRLVDELEKAASPG